MQWLIPPDPATAAQVAASAIAIYVTVIAVNRINGLRTFAKVSGYDFAATVAIGSIIAGVTLTGTTPVTSGVVAVVSIVGAQRLLTVLRRRSPIKQIVDNPPALLVHHGTVLHDSLRRTGFAEDDLREKIRTAGAAGLHEVAAVVLETSGDVSVVLGEEAALDPWLFTGVRGEDRLPGT